MFDIHKVSDKYKILYLKEGVKNKFLTLLLIGLDDQYMDTDLETLNNSSNYYKKNLNQKIQHFIFIRFVNSLFLKLRVILL